MSQPSSDLPTSSSSDDPTATPTAKTPRSGYDKAGGLFYFPRMLDKIRLFARGALRSDFHANLGRGADGWCTNYLRIDYAELRERVLTGGTDEEILAWCYERGRRLNDIDVWIWNQFASRIGWRDAVAPRLAKLKGQSNLANRDDIVTMFDYFDVDEGRKP